MTANNTLCASGDCPLLDLCDRRTDVETAIKARQSVTVFTWSVDDAGRPDCDALVPRPEWEDVE